MIRFEYVGFHGCRCVCGLDIHRLADGRTLVICTELPENTGTSITNFAEELANLVCQRFAIRPTELVWIEHHSTSHLHNSKPALDWVEFAWAGRRLTNPRWRPVRAVDWKQLGITAQTCES